MKDWKSVTEKKLADKFNRKHAFLVGRGTTAIYITLKSLLKKNSEILLPATTCPDPAYAAIYAGMKLKFCDVNLKDYMLNIKSLKNNISKKTKAIIPIHLFGAMYDYSSVENIAESNNLYVIEDAAQSLGATIENKPAGTLGDVSILSFGKGKVLNAKGGGAILTDNLEIAKKVKFEIKKLPEADYVKNEKLYKKYRNHYYSIKKLSDNSRIFRKLYFYFPEKFKESYIFKIDNKHSKIINHELDNLKNNISKRRKNASMYRKFLKHPDIIHPKYDKSNPVYSRYSVIIRTGSKEVGEMLRSNGFHANEMYPPINNMFGLFKLSKFLPNAEFISKHILNLWTDPDISEEYIKESCNLISNFLEKKE